MMNINCVFVLQKFGDVTILAHVDMHGWESGLVIGMSKILWTNC